MRPSLVCASWTIFIRSTDFRATLEYNVREKWCIGGREKEIVEGGEESKRELVSKRKEEIMEMQRNTKLKGHDDCIQHLPTTVKCKCQAVSCVCMWGLCISTDMHTLSCSAVSEPVTLWTVARRAPLSVEFSRQEYRIQLSFPATGDLPNPRIKPICLLHWQAASLPLSHMGSPYKSY